MKIDLHVIDAFTSRPFTGNPAAVCILREPVDHAWMQQVAAEMNLSETAFLHPVESGWSLRWFTPVTEVDLCGHATLASAHALWESGAAERTAPLHFHTRSGELICRTGPSGITMDFPALATEPCDVPEIISPALGCAITGAAFTGMDWLCEIADPAVLRRLQPNFGMLATIPARGVIITARSDDPAFDFISRFFGPAVGVNEDPVTGSAHCALGPYWAKRLGKSDLRAWQASPRGGELQVSVRGSRVSLTGEAVTVSRVELSEAVAMLRNG